MKIPIFSGWTSSTTTFSSATRATRSINSVWKNNNPGTRYQNENIVGSHVVGEYSEDFEGPIGRNRTKNACTVKASPILFAWKSGSTLARISFVASRGKNLYECWRIPNLLF